MVDLRKGAATSKNQVPASTQNAGGMPARSGRIRFQQKMADRASLCG